MRFGCGLRIIQVRDKIDELTRMDKRLYEAGVAEFEKVRTHLT